MKKLRLPLLSVQIVLMALVATTAVAQYQPRVQLGIDRLIANPSDKIMGKRLGLITNPTGLTSNMRSNIDALFYDKRFQLTALFGPEHGVRGDIQGGGKIEDYQDSKTGVPVYSLFGKILKPTQEMLANVEVMLFDIQDIGIRPYTYIYTMAYAMEAAKANNIPFVVLDRPNPMGGLLVEGPVLEKQFKSFIGLYPIPYVYGMTVGELAQLFNKEFGIDCDLTVIPVAGWTRDMLFPATGLIWVPTSPHLPHPETCFYIAATGGYGELGTISEGVGTPLPFEICGAPWVDSDKLAQAMNNYNLPGIFFRGMVFRPFYLRMVDQFCGGVQLHITDFREFQPMRTQIHLLTTLKKLFPEQDFFADSERLRSFDLAMGSDQVRKDIQAGKSADEIIASWQDELEDFLQIRARYLIYK